MLRLEHTFVLCWNLDTSESRSETHGRFTDTMLERMEKISWTDRVRKEVLRRTKEERKIPHTMKRSKINWNSACLPSEGK
jgi:hypothetical protein